MSKVIINSNIEVTGAMSSAINEISSRADAIDVSEIIFNIDKNSDVGSKAQFTVVVNLKNRHGKESSAKRTGGDFYKLAPSTFKLAVSNMIKKVKKMESSKRGKGSIKNAALSQEEVE